MIGTGRRHQRVATCARVALAVVLVALISMNGSRPSARADWCTEPPAPVSPDRGVTGLLNARPETIPDEKQDPFAPGSRVRLGDVYGFNWYWSTYDLGCGGSLRDPVAVLNTANASSVMSFGSALLAWMDMLEKLAHGDSFGWATDVVASAASALHDMILGIPSGNGGQGSGQGIGVVSPEDEGQSAKIGLLPLAAVVLGVFLVWRARRANYSETFTSSLVFLSCAALAVFTLAFPTLTTQTVDRGARSLAELAGAPFNASVSDTINREAAYQVWLTGYFGSADSPLAEEYGPRLLDATHYSWYEIEQIEADPQVREEIDDRKADEFRAIAEAVEKESPSTYEVFQGRTDRGPTAAFGVFSILCMGLFGFLASLLVLVGRVMMFALVVAAPVAVVLGILPAGRPILQRMWGLFTAAIVTIVKYTVGAGVMALVLGGLINLDRSLGELVFWIAIATIVGLMVLKPMRSFKTMMPGLDPDRSYLRQSAHAVVAGFSYLAGRGSVSTPEPEPTTEAVGPAAAHAEALEGADRQEPLAALPRPTWMQASAAIGSGPSGADRAAADSGSVQLLPGPTALADGRDVASLAVTATGPTNIHGGIRPNATASDSDDEDGSGDIGTTRPDVHEESFRHPSGITVIVPRDPSLYHSTPEAVSEENRRPDSALAPVEDATIDPVAYRSGRSAAEAQWADRQRMVGAG